MFTLIKLLVLPFKLLKLFALLSIEVVKFILILPFLVLGVIEKWIKKEKTW